MNKNIQIILGIIVLVLVGWFFVNQGEPKIDEPIKVGFIVPLTGFAAEYGEKIEKISSLALSEYQKENEKASKIEFIFEDDKGDSKEAVTVAQKMIQIDQVDALVVLLANSIAGVEPIANQYEIPLLGVGTVSSEVHEESDYLFVGLASPYSRGVASADYLIDKLGDPIISTISNLQNDLGITWLKGFKDRYQERDKLEKIVLMETSSGFDNKDFKTTLLKADEKQVEFIVTTTVFNDTPFLLKQAREMGLEFKYFGTGDLENQFFIDNAGNDAEGVIFNSVIFDVNNLNSVGKKVQELIKTNFDLDLGLLESAFWDSSMTIIKASVGKGDLVDSLNNLKIEGILGPIEFDEVGNMKTRGNSFKTIKDGKFELLEIIK